MTTKPAVDGEAAHKAAIDLLTAVSELVRVTAPMAVGPQPPDPVDYAQKCALLADQRIREVGQALGMILDPKHPVQ